jgi:hypothetical protein
MVSPDTRRSRKRRQKELRRSRWVIPRRPASRSRTHRAARARSGARPHSSSTARTSAGGSRVPSARARRGRARVWLSGSRRRLRRWSRWWRDDWFRWLGRFWRHHCGGCVRNRLDSHVLQSLASRIATTSSASAARGTGTTGTKRVLTLEILRRKGIENQEDDERMHKKRGGDTLPPPLPLAPARYADWRPIALFYCAGASLGDTPMTFTPAPRATSIA